MLRDQFALAMRYMQSGNPLGAQGLLEDIVATEPAHFEALHVLGVSYAMSGNLDKAEALISKAIAIKPDHAEALGNLGKVLHNRQKLDEAIDCLDKAIRLQPQLTDAHLNRGLVLEDLNRLEEALSSYDKVIALKPDCAEAYMNRGIVETRLNRLADALASHDRAIALKPDFGDAHGNRGDVLQKLNRLADALTSYETAISLRPGFALEYNSRGGVLEKLHRHEEAVASYGRAIALQPDLAEAYCNRAHALYELNRTEEALDDYAAALRLDPDFALAKNNIASHYLGQLSDFPQIDRLCMEAAELKLKQEYASPQARSSIQGFRARHDLEQATYLIALGYAFEWLHQAHRRLAGICARHLAAPEDSASLEAIPLSAEEAGDINIFRRSLLRYTIADPVEHCLNPDNDWKAIEDRYFSCAPEMIAIDDLLSQQALRELRNFCLVSTVWKSEYRRNQYLGAFATSGFVSSLHLRIALELKRKMPRIFGEHNLEQLWAFKYDSRSRHGINIHADFAKVNLNFWVTPDAANLDPESGGLIVHDVPCPPSWGLEEYNGNEMAVRDFLENNRSGSMRVPYRCNRAVLFNSALFHETDHFRFKDGYENRRINITYLFGKGLKTY
ncbi:MAG: hypothetical protein A3I02_16115 [Betaproteobacteria bacterium RIFCSPLOWO2_02_FULL_67_26]|nr:MAG: hypothetical protein A3I02_16115 [Betaproteobacteria bacterium RIFCSPLOWO2_02_FULL_67_26]